MLARVMMGFMVLNFPNSTMCVVASSWNQCWNTFRGPVPESEPETIAIENAVHGIGSRLKVFLTVHSYSQLWMTGWSYTNRTSDNHEEEVGIYRNYFEIFSAFIAIVYVDRIRQFRFS